MIPYPKIEGPYRRHTEGELRNQLITNEWTSDELFYLATNDWVFTEKVDGTNIRVGWDGYNVSFAGRSDKAQIPATLLTELERLFPEGLLEQVFGEKSATLYGEGYGAGIQKGGAYRADKSFILFDVLMAGTPGSGWRGSWLRRLSVVEIAASLNIDVVPVLFVSDIYEAIYHIKQGYLSEVAEGRTKEALVAEGVVGTPLVELLRRDGRPVKVKIKSVDFLSAT